MELRHALLAQYVSDDTDAAGNFTAAGIFFETNADSYPTAFDSGFLHLILDGVSGEPGESVLLRIVLRLEEPATVVGEIKSLYPKPVDAERPFTYISIRLGIKGLVLPAPGHYSFDIFIDGDLKQSLRLIAGNNSREDL